MATRYLTVVFAIEDEAEFKPLQKQFHSKMFVEDKLGWRVSAMSLGDEMTKMELLESAITEVSDLYELQEVCGKIISTPLTNLEGKTISDFIR